MAPGQGTGFTSVGQYLDANQGTIANETGQINSDIGGQIDSAKSAADSLIGGDKANYQKDYTSLPGYGDALDKAIAAGKAGAAIQTHGGLSDYFQSHFKDTQSQAGFDASLLDGGRFSDLGTKGSGLVDYLNGGLAGVKPETPATPTGPRSYPWDGEPKPPGIPGPGSLPITPDNGVPGDFNHRGGH